MISGIMGKFKFMGWDTEFRFMTGTGISTNCEQPGWVPDCWQAEAGYISGRYTLFH